MIKTQKLKFTCLAIFISFVMVLMSMAWLSMFSTNAKAADDNEISFTKFTPKAVVIDNNQFGSSSGSLPKTPDSWTGGGVNGMLAGNTISGVIDLDKYSENASLYKLEEDYPDEFKGDRDPDSPFNSTNTINGNRNVLMVNVRPGATSGTAYGYASSAMTFEANKFYMVQAHVRTGDFKAGDGAAIRLTGLDDNVAFSYINTMNGISKDLNGYILNEDNDYGWQDFTFYVAAPSVGSKTVNLSLQVGDSYTAVNKEASTHDTATGYAFFDNITAYEISPSVFYENKETNTSNRVLIKDYSDISDYIPNSDTAYDATNYNFNATPNKLAGWELTRGEGGDWANATYGVVDGFDPFDTIGKNEYNIKKDPVSAMHKFETDSNILVISSYNVAADDYNNVAVGLRSPSFTIERYKYYRVSAWVKTQDVEGGNGATLGFTSNRIELGSNSDEQNKKDNIFAKISNATGDDANLSRAGFKLHSFYVQGSVLRDYDANLECWLGTEGSESKGVAMFDNISVKEITPKDFTENSASGTIVNMDTEAGIVDAGITFAETGVTNGNFYNVGEYTEFKFPMPVKDWTSYTVDTVGTTNYSTDNSFVDTKNVISGIVPVDAAHFDANKSNYGNANISPAPNKTASMLMITSSTPTAYSYRSANFTLTAPTAESTTAQMGKLSVNLHAYGLTGSGANLVLKQGNKVIATIENIKDTLTSSGGKTYSFYIEQGKTDISDLSVEIWLGLNDRYNNSTKLASGTIFVEQVKFEMVNDEYRAKRIAYDAAKVTGLENCSMATYSFKNERLDAFDAYEDNFVKYPYNFTANVIGTDANNVTYGIFNPNDGLGSQTIIPRSFKNTVDTSEDANKNVLVLKNPVPAASTLTLDTKYNLNADTYYKLTVRAKVDIPDQDNKLGGAFIKLTDTEYAFKNITKTYEVHDQNTDYEVFQTFTFYVKVGSEAKSVGLSIGLGDAASTARYTTGIIYVNEITFTDITNVLYEENTSDDALEKNPYFMKAELSATAEETPEETPNEKSKFDFLIIPSILFGVAILTALVGFCIRRIMTRRKATMTYEKTVSYDRAATLNKDFNKQAKSEEDMISNVTDNSANDNTYDTFSDDKDAKVEKPVKTVTEKPAEANDVQPTEVKKDFYTDMFEDDMPKADEDVKTEETVKEDTAKTEEVEKPKTEDTAEKPKTEESEKTE